MTGGSPLLRVVRLPYRIARDAKIEILHIIIIITHINNFRTSNLIHVGLTRGIRAFHIINPRKRRIHLRIGIDDMIELLLSAFQLGLKYTYILRRRCLVHMSTTSTIIRQIIPLFFVDSDIVHIIAYRAKFHYTITKYIILYILYSILFLIPSGRSSIQFRSKSSVSNSILSCDGCNFSP